VPRQRERGDKEVGRREGDVEGMHTHRTRVVLAGVCALTRRCLHTARDAARRDIRAA
jgi:hypothetical protein